MPAREPGAGLEHLPLPPHLVLLDFNYHEMKRQQSVWKYISTPAHRSEGAREPGLERLSLPPELEAVPAQVVGPPRAALRLVELVALAQAARALAWGNKVKHR